MAYASAKENSVADGKVRVRVDLSRSVASIPPDFIGLGYEISSVARVGLSVPKTRFTFSWSEL